MLNIKQELLVNASNELNPSLILNNNRYMRMISQMEKRIVEENVASLLSFPFTVLKYNKISMADIHQLFSLIFEIIKKCEHIEEVDLISEVINRVLDFLCPLQDDMVLKKIEPMVLLTIIKGLCDLFSKSGKDVLSHIQEEKNGLLLFCHLTYAFTQLLSIDMETECLLYVCRCLRLMLTPCLITSVLPGVCISVTNFLFDCYSSNQFSMLSEYLALLFDVINIAGSVEEKQDKEWRTTTCTKLKTLLYKVLKKFVNCPNKEVRIILGRKVTLLLGKRHAITVEAEHRFLDVAAILLYDNDEQVQLSVKNSYCSNCKIQNLVIENFTTTLVTMTKMSDLLPVQQKVLLRTFCGYLKMFGKSGLTMFCLCKKQAFSLMNALVNSIEVRMRVVDIFEDCDCFWSSSKSQMMLLIQPDNSVVLVTPTDNEAVSFYLDAFNFLVLIEDLDLLVDCLNFKRCRQNFRPEELFVVNSILHALMVNRPAVGSQLARSLLPSALARLVENRSFGKLNVILLLETIKFCALLLKEEIKEHLMPSLYAVLRLTLREESRRSAMLTLNSIAVALNQANVDELLLSNIGNLSSSLLIQFHFYSLYPELSLMVSALLDRFVDLKHVEPLAPVLQEMLLVLDHSDEHPIDNLCHLISALTRFCKFCNSDSKANVPIEGQAEDERKDKLPWHLVLVVEIMHRARAWIRSGSIQTRIGFLELIVYCVQALCQCRRTLLPLLHRLWPALLCRLDDSDVICQFAAFKTLVACVENSGTFYSMRIQKEAWPIFDKFFFKLAERSRRAGTSYMQTVHFRFQLHLISAMPKLFATLQVSLEIMESCVSCITMYLDEKQPDLLRQSAQKSLNALAEMKNNFLNEE
ncbi:TELO2-interacting protein 1 -like protein [Trichinella pseudospiralis]|uniref:TELO2-interacting protein 1-like protein n=1 Tax=Trichinella pseudospiralis TaxID=6337 RepID=A0A0V1JE82_TRIPS|nr:TELO2-interacting protein 1 -like protein [Trichinella pseudospiralis]